MYKKIKRDEYLLNAVILSDYIKDCNRFIHFSSKTLRYFSIKAMSGKVS
jgi:hypothetical protein